MGLLAAAALAVAALGACQGTPPEDEQTPGDDVSTLTPEEPEETTTDPAPTQTGPLDDRSQAAVDDLAEQLGIDASAIEVGRLEEVTWTDGSIGCPEPGKHYTQALVPGARLILTVDGETYAYHGERDEPLFFCENPTDPAPSDEATA